jgi:hypothetical protein
LLATTINGPVNQRVKLLGLALDYAIGVKDKRALLLVDVDCVLAPFGAEPAEGYRSHRFGEVQVMLAPELNGERLRDLANSFELVWCTAREHDVLSTIGPAHGLPELDVIVFGTTRLTDGTILVPGYGQGITWKLATVSSWAGDRPLAWLDDDLLHTDVLEWARVRSAAGIPTQLVRVDPGVGLADEHVETLTQFGWAHMRSEPHTTAPYP